MATVTNRDKVTPSPLQFEKRIVELEGLLNKAETDAERTTLAAELENERSRMASELTPWQRVELARHAQRPKMLDYVSRLFEDFIELHGDRCSGDDAAMVGGIARFKGQTVVCVGTQKGTTTEDKIHRKFGMARPQGYRKALRLFEMAERLHFPIITLVDTPAADPHPDSENDGQGPAIAANLLYLMRVKTPVFSVVLGEGGSGGALGIAVGDWVAMFEHAIYVICPPERCAEILWRDASKKEIAAAALKITAHDLKSLGVIDSVISEPQGGAHRNPDAAADALSKEIISFLDSARAGEWSPERRQQKFRRMGIWKEVSLSARSRQHPHTEVSPAPSRITIRVQPKASRNACNVDDAGRIRVALTAPPVDGAANDALVRYVSDLLQVPRRSIAIVSGEKSRDKILAIDGMSVDAVLARLRNAG